MPCFHPLSAYRTYSGDIIFHSNHKNIVEKMKLPCGRCVGCRLERSRQWAVRCMHEKSLYDENCFITLTYSPAFLPKDNSVKVEHFQKFMKRLRKRFPDRRIRFFHCGEYGEKSGRPHYHAILFNFDFPDKCLWEVRRGFNIWRSDTLESLWPMGRSEIGSVTFESAAYVARYIMKKVNGDDANEHYDFTDPQTGQIFQRSPEYITMSRRPGIGADWYDRYGSDVFPHDRVVINGRECKPPRFYDNRFQIDDPVSMEFIRLNRQNRAQKSLDDTTPDRLQVREKVQLRSLEYLPRTLD